MWVLLLAGAAMIIVFLTMEFWAIKKGSASWKWVESIYNKYDFLRHINW